MPAHRMVPGVQCSIVGNPKAYDSFRLREYADQNASSADDPPTAVRWGKEYLFLLMWYLLGSLFE